MRPYTPEELKQVMEQHVYFHAKYLATVKERGLMLGLLTQIVPNNIDRYALTKYLTGRASSKSLSGAQVKSLIEWMEPEKGEHGWFPSEMSKAEAKEILKEVMKEQGQETLL